MLDERDLTPGQQAGVDRLVEWDRTLMVAEMGFGKSVVTLTAIRELLDLGVVTRVLVIAPLRVCGSVWVSEAEKWTHLQGLRVGWCRGGASEREAVLSSDCDVVVINFELLVWLFRESSERGRGLFDGLVVDEISRMRVTGGTQFKALRWALREFSWRVGLTGTPVAEDWRGLHGQMLVVDDGAALGTRADKYLRRYFYPTDYNEYNWELMEGAGEKIARAVRGVVSVAEQYSGELPPLVEIREPVEASEEAGEAMEGLREAGEFDGVVAGSAAVVSGKLEQLACGFLYASEGDSSAVVRYDYQKVDKVAQIVARERERGGVLVCYWFKAELEALRERLFNRAGGAVVLSEARDASEAVERFNRAGGVMLLHPRSAGHGLNLARGGASVVWCTLPWSRDLYLQTNARLWRRGQTREEVRVFWLDSGGIDTVKKQRVDGKGEWMALFKRLMV